MYWWRSSSQTQCECEHAVLQCVVSTAERKSVGGAGACEKDPAMKQEIVRQDGAGAFEGSDGVHDGDA